ncbi:hypothetical protein FA13DRAFT_1709623 [Coprinellus micaceus]|uniref:Uncharacterized protein n=1 Tax=Coprinellus micaceus TaxID=71717 RepID=A0A4Y7TC49_COPMI|nr:hypothetical protein FA13DRAFT_1709623 [Coprinellus micaceus]
MRARGVRCRGRRRQVYKDVGSHPIVSEYNHRPVHLPGQHTADEGVGRSALLLIRAQGPVRYVQDERGAGDPGEREGAYARLAPQSQWRACLSGRPPNFEVGTKVRYLVFAESKSHSSEPAGQGASERVRHTQTQSPQIQSSGPDVKREREAECSTAG